MGHSDGSKGYPIGDPAPAADALETKDQMASSGVTRRGVGSGLRGHRWLFHAVHLKVGQDAWSKGAACSCSWVVSQDRHSLGWFCLAPGDANVLQVCNDALCRWSLRL
jgi:hypothetical protein